MKNKDILLKIIADLIFIWVAAFLSTSILYGNKIYSQSIIENQESIATAGAKIVDLISTLGFLHSTTFLIPFIFFGVYSNSSNDFRDKMLLLVKAIAISILLLSFVFILTNFSSVLSASSPEGIWAVLNTSDPPITTLLVTLFIAVGCMITSRIWIFAYSKSKLTRYAKEIETADYSRNVLLIGGAGYIGSALIRRLLDNNYRVKVLDVLLFGTDPIREFINQPNFELIEADFRKVDDLVVAMQDCDSVVHLGGIVGDPASAIDEYLTTEVNLTSTKIVAQIGKAAGVKRFIFASSCSVYGAQDDIMDETSTTNPLSLYAQTKLASEKVLFDMHSEEFSSVILRFGTIYGISGRTRFDLIINLLTAKGLVEKNITVYGPNQTRPFLHVSDAANAVLLTLLAPLGKVRNQIFNIGSSSQNFTLMEVAEKIRAKLPDAEITVSDLKDDARNYNVSFQKASEILGFKPSWTVDAGIDQIIALFKSGKITDYKDSIHNNYQYMTKEGKNVLTENVYSGWEQELL